jgi:hypothetical protein
MAAPTNRARQRVIILGVISLLKYIAGVLSLTGTRQSPGGCRAFRPVRTPIERLEPVVHVFESGPGEAVALLQLAFQLVAATSTTEIVIGSLPHSPWPAFDLLPVAFKPGSNLSISSPLS